MTFEDFLKDRHAEGYHGIDDDMPGSFDSWLASMDVAECIEHAEEYADLRVKEATEAWRLAAN